MGALKPLLILIPAYFAALAVYLLISWVFARSRHLLIAEDGSYRELFFAGSVLAWLGAACVAIAITRRFTPVHPEVFCGVCLVLLIALQLRNAAELGRRQTLSLTLANVVALFTGAALAWVL